jgi:hypothetical protein
MNAELAGTAGRRSKRLLAVVLLSTGLGMGAAAACGSSGTAGRAAGAAASADPLAKLSAGQIFNRAVGDLRTTNAVRVTGNVTSSGQYIRLDLTLLGSSRCKGRLSLRGKGSFRLIMIGKTVWIKPDRKFWTTFGGTNSAALHILAGKYLRLSARGNGNSLGSLAALCKPARLAGSFGGISSAATAIRQRVTVAGQPAVRLSARDGKGSDSLEVSDSATPQILRIAGTGSTVADIKFTGYGHTVPLSAPPARQTLSGKRFGL